ncbi:MAG: MBL fold metallo-hydrolase [Chthoniobacteraceae bacterium]
MPPNQAFPDGRDAEHGSAIVRFWGVRGSIPVPGPQTVGYGGNTSCVEVRADGQIIILDAGTGVRALGISLTEEFRGRPLSLTMLITHTHSDHIQGFPFLAPAYEASNHIRILGFSEGGCGLQKAFARQMYPAYFPVGLSQMRANIAFEELAGDAFQIGSIRVSTCRANHPGNCGGYRLDTGAGSICYIPDHEADGSHAPKCAAVAQLIHEADLVILDSQYTAEEYRGHEGWGHSSMEDAVRTACDARAKCLHLFHHDPSHSYGFLDQMLQEARRIAADSGTLIEAAREGRQVTLAAC